MHLEEKYTLKIPNKKDMTKTQIQAIAEERGNKRGMLTSSQFNSHSHYIALSASLTIKPDTDT